jgi:hypothetical protein
MEISRKIPSSAAAAAVSLVEHVLHEGGPVRPRGQRAPRPKTTNQPKEVVGLDANAERHSVRERSVAIGGSLTNSTIDTGDERISLNARVMICG